MDETSTKVEAPGYLEPVMAIYFVRVAIFAMVLLAVAIATVPILVLIDLLDGGTGWGLCPGGLQVCDRPYSTGAELVIVLTLGLFGTVIGIRLLVRLGRRMRDDSYQVSQ